MSWRDAKVGDVPMRSVISVDRREPLRDEDVRFARDGVVIVVEDGVFAYWLQRGSAWIHTAPYIRAPGVQRSERLGRVGCEMWQLEVIVDERGAPLGLLGWDDVVRFALAHGGDDACWRQPAKAATRRFDAITPMAGVSERQLGPLRDVREVALAMLARPRELGRMNDATQCLLEDQGFVTPKDLLRAIFGDEVLER